MEARTELVAKGRISSCRSARHLGDVERCRAKHAGCQNGVQVQQSEFRSCSAWRELSVRRPDRREVLNLLAVRLESFRGSARYFQANDLALGSDLGTGLIYRREVFFLARFLPGIIFFTERAAELAAFFTLP